MMTRFALLVASIVIGLILASCATLSQEQCEAGDWRSIGFRDGAQGRLATYVSNHADACAEYGVSVDRALYDQGRSDGLGSYCRLSNAESEGRNGRPYRGVCAGELGASFARVHAAAMRISSANAEINSLDAEISQLIRRLAQPGQPPEQVSALTRQLQSLQRDRRMEQLGLRTLEAQLLRLRTSEQTRLASLGISA